jgi:hypothetical protein
MHATNFIISFGWLQLGFFSVCEEISFSLANLNQSLKQLVGSTISFYVGIIWISLPMGMYMVVASQTTQSSLCILGLFKFPTP